MITTKTEIITPETAARILDSNTSNRSLRENWAYELSSRMKSGQWISNGETIKIMENGDLVDGQHRLRAIILSGKPQQMIVVRGVPNNSFGTIDIGLRRSTGDTFTILGCKNSKMIACATYLYLQAKTRKALSGYEKPSIQDQEMVLNKDFDAWQRCGSAVAGLNHTKRTIVIPSMACFFLFVTSKTNDEKSDFFFQNLIGNGSDKTVQLLRNRLEENAISKARLPSRYILALYIKTWNAFIAGEKIKTLRWSENEDFPKMKVDFN
jgi:hypothetical protein